MLRAIAVFIVGLHQSRGYLIVGNVRRILDNFPAHDTLPFGYFEAHINMLQRHALTLMDRR